MSQLKYIEVIETLGSNFIFSIQAGIKFERQNNFLFASVIDNCKGFDQEILKQNNGIGWENIFSKVGMINGDIKINSKIGLGTSINIQIPL